MVCKRFKIVGRHTVWRKRNQSATSWQQLYWSTKTLGTISIPKTGLLCEKANSTSPYYKIYNQQSYSSSPCLNFWSFRYFWPFHSFIKNLDAGFMETRIWLGRKNIPISSTKMVKFSSRLFQNEQTKL